MGLKVSVEGIRPLLLEIMRNTKHINVTGKKKKLHSNSSTMNFSIF